MLNEKKFHSEEEIAAELFHWLTGLDYEEHDTQVILDKYEAVAKLEQIVIACRLSPAKLNKVMREYDG